MLTKRTFWYCGGPGNGHVVGELVYVELNQRGRQTALRQYEISLEEEPEEVPPARNEAVVGTVKGMRCTICGALFNWYVGDAAMRQILGKRGI